ncbi:hypothetical protein P13BB106kb_p090 [Pectobacterium phage DU_PP_V]|uniref:Uncharacterized protein n=1 Tax=Pectobacterium phage DU_PP_V TaxID=2041492 RepID=A0A2D2W780_9CAUD|nr:DprA-like DNA recombination-mediator protein [Pectobacterium phage DU_PP_V]ATS94074.1 hypothetical protein P13BB106kb_p090 [Pectobacterium phage DU_PP_V]
MTNFYTGIGSRETPISITDHMSDIAVELYHLGFWLRSGRAKRADYAFQRGAEYAAKDTRVYRQEIYLPDTSFEKQFGNIGAILPSKFDNYEDAEYLVSTIHKAGDNLRGFARRAHTRNMYQVLGQDLNTPSRFLICYAKPEGKTRVSGGTNSAWVLAGRNNVPRYNLWYDSALQDVYSLIEDLKCKP